MGNHHVSVNIDGGDKLSIGIKGSETVLDFKQKIFHHSNIPVEKQHLFVNNTPLVDFETLSTYHIHKHDTITLFQTTFINLHDPIVGRKLNRVVIELSDTMLSFKEKIHEQVDSYKVDTMLFLTEDKQLGDDNSATLEQCGLKCGDTVDVVRRLRNEYNDLFFIYVDTQDGESIPVRVTVLDKVNDIKLTVVTRKGIPTNEQDLIYNNIKMEDDEDIINYYIKVNDNIQLEIHS